MLKITYGPKIDYQFCNGCSECYEACPMDVFGWDKEKGRPTVAYPAECSFCCVCEFACPEVAVDLRLPLHAMLDFGIYPEKV